MIPNELVLLLVLISTLAPLLYIEKNKGIFAKGAERHISAKQAVHMIATPRIGGIAVAIGILSGALLSGNNLFSGLLWTTLPIFLVGLFEDLRSDTPPMFRIGVAALSALLAVFLLNTHVTRIDIPGFDFLMTFTVVSIAFTVFASTGMTHAMNLIDGLNGLSSAVVIAVTSSFGLIAYKYGHSDLMGMNAIICVAFLSFMFVNFPNGKIFLGDAGAYSVGHLIAWNAIILLTREPDISAFAILLVVLWPVIDTLFAMIRRFTRGVSVSHPDKLHYHHVLMRLVLLLSRGSIGKKEANPIGSVLSWPFIALPCVAGYFLAENPRAAFFAVSLFILAYIISYHLLVRNAVKFRRKRVNAETH